MATKNIVFEDADIVFLNFQGKEGMYNKEGDRNFCILLDPVQAEEMRQDGWNIKLLKAREENEDPRPYIQVSIGFKGRPPNIVLITSRGKTTLSEEEVEIIDWIDIAKVDLIINPYNWGPINGKSGVKAYLKSFFVTMDENVLDLRYADVPELEATKSPLQIERPTQLAIGPGEDDVDDDKIFDAEIVED